MTSGHRTDVVRQATTVTVVSKAEAGVSQVMLDPTSERRRRIQDRADGTLLVAATATAEVRLTAEPEA